MSSRDSLEGLREWLKRETFPHNEQSHWDVWGDEEQFLVAVKALLDSVRLEGIQQNAIEWELRPETSPCAGDEIRLVRRDGFEGRRWAIMQRGYCLNKSGDWEHEPIPSSRTEEWLKTVRWNTLTEAIAAWERPGAALEGESK